MRYAVIFLMFLTGCHSHSVDDDIKFENGQCTQIKISGEEGMIVGMRYHGRSYVVRVALASKTNSAIFGASNTENQRYALVLFQEYELTNCALAGESY